MIKILKVISFFVSGERCQNLLQKLVLGMQYLMGLGSGGNVKESGESVLLSRMIKLSDSKKHVVFDIGAGKGEFLDLLLSKCVERNMEVYCFEPSKVAFNDLARVAAGRSDVHLECLGVGDVAKKAILYADVPGSELASITKRDLSYLGNSMRSSEQIEVVTLDDYCSSKGVCRINLLKIDVEGHEYDVLMGAQKMLKSGAVDILSFEFSEAALDVRRYFKDYYELISGYDMVIFRITPAGTLHPIRQYREYNEQFKCANYCAIKRALLERS